MLSPTFKSPEFPSKILMSVSPSKFGFKLGSVVAVLEIISGGVNDIYYLHKYQRNSPLVVNYLNLLRHWYL